MIMDKQIYTTKQIDFPYYQYKAYRIEVDITNKQTFQRHIWIKEDESTDKSEWIETVQQTPEQLIYRGYSKVK